MVEATVYKLNPEYKEFSFEVNHSLTLVIWPRFYARC